MGALPSVNIQSCCVARDKLDDDEICFITKAQEYLFAGESVESCVKPPAFALPALPETKKFENARSNGSDTSDGPDSSTVATDDSEAMRFTDDILPVSDNTPVAVSENGMYRHLFALAYICVFLTLGVCIRYQVYGGIYTTMTILFCRQMYDVWTEGLNPRFNVVERPIEPHTPYITASIPRKEKKAKPVPTFWLVICKYEWGLCYTVNLNQDGTVNTAEPLTLGWKKMSRPLDDNPVLDGDVGALFEGDPVDSGRNIWEYKSSVDDAGRCIVVLNVAKSIKLHIQPDCVRVEHEGELKLVTHAWVHLEYFWGGIPNINSISVQVQHYNETVMSN